MSEKSDSGTLISPSEADHRTIETSQVQVQVQSGPTSEVGQLISGETLGGRFRIEELIQSGGMGDVYRATDLVANEAVAVKTLRPGASTVSRFEREAARLSELNHHGIPKYVAHDLSADHGPYLVMEWFDGVDLGQYLKTHALGFHSAVTLGVSIAEAVAHAHLRGIVHRDLNPNNILVQPGEPLKVKVLDFGIAKLEADERPLTAEGTQIGTPGYMAPEQVEGRAQVDARTDVFALGCILYELIGGQRAFYAPTIREVLTRIVADNPEPLRTVRRSTPPELERLVQRLLEKDPRARPSSAEEVLRLLLELPEVNDLPPSHEEPSMVTSSVQQVSSVIVLRDPGESTYERVSQAVSPHGLSLHRTKDATLVVSTRGRGTAGDHAARAARCALAIQKATRCPQIAVATGLAHSGGARPVGRAFDSALVSLLLKDSESTGVSGPCLWLDENTASLLDSRFDVRSVDQGFLLRGMRETYESARTVLGQRTTCVGRRRELSTLAATLKEAVEESSASAVLITGDPGIGKTRLALEMVRAARRGLPNVEVFRGNSDVITAGSPFSALTSAISSGFRIRDSEPDVVRREKVQNRVNQVLPKDQRQRVSDFLCELIGIPVTRERSAQLQAARRDAVLRGDQISRALQDWLQAECRKQPVVFILDDFHWGDLSTVKFVDATLRNLAECPLVLLVLARPEVHEVFPDLWSRRGITELRLGGLSRRAITEMVREVLGADVSAGVIDRVVKRAQGNPFWVEELLRAENAGQGDNVPDRVVLLAQSRIEQQSAEERRMLEAASVFGRKFWLGGAQAVLGAQVMNRGLDVLARELTESEFILENDLSRLVGEKEFVFASGLLRDAAYSLMDDSEREVAHLRAAEWLENNGESDPLAIALHFTLGGEPDRARAHYLRAAEQALAGDDLDAAISCAEEGLGAGARGQDAVRLYLVHAEASKWRGDNATAFRSAQAAFARAEESTLEWYRAAAEAAVAAGKSGKTESSLAIAKELMESPVKDPTRGERAIALSRVAGQMVLSGHIDSAQKLLVALEESDDQLQPDPYVMGFFCEARALLLGASDAPEGRIHYAELAASYFDTAGDLRNACLTRLSQGYAEVEFGYNERALSTLQEALRVAKNMGLDNSIPVAELQRGRALARTGELDEGLSILESAGRTFDRQKNVRLAGMARAYQTEALVMAGSLDAALETARRAETILEGVPAMQRLAQAWISAICAHRNDEKIAEEAGTAAVNQLRPESRLAVGETLIRVGGACGLWIAGQKLAAEKLLHEEQARLQILASKLDEASKLVFVNGCPARQFLLQLQFSGPTLRTAPDFISFLGAQKGLPSDGESQSAIGLRDPDLGLRPGHSSLEQLPGNAESDPVGACLQLAKRYHRIGEEMARTIDRENLSWALFVSQIALSMSRSLRKDDLATSVAQYFEFDGAGSKLFSGARAKILGFLGFTRRLTDETLAEVRRRAKELVVARHRALSRMIPVLDSFMLLLRSEPQEKEVTEFTAELEQRASLKMRRATPFHKGLVALYQAARAEDSAERAQWILAGNCRLLFHDQTALQEDIEQIVASDVSVQVMDRLRRRTWFLLRPLFPLVGILAGPFLKRLSEYCKDILPRYALELSLAEGRRSPSLNGPPRNPSHEFPVHLQHIWNPKTEALLERFERPPENRASHDPKGWGDLNVRMAYLVDVLREEQQSLDLLELRLTDEEVHCLQTAEAQTE